MRLGWPVTRAVDVFGQRTDDAHLFARAAAQGWVFVTADEPVEAIANEWLAEGRSFRGLICWRQGRMTTAGLLECFEELAGLDQPFPIGYPVLHLKAKS